MRKILLSLMALVAMALPADALYLIGSPAGGFSPSKGIEMETIDDLDHPAWGWQGEIGSSDYFCFATELDPDNNWDNFNANYRLSPSESNMQIANGKFELLKGVDASFKGAGVETKLTVHLIDDVYSLDVELLQEPIAEELHWGFVGDYTDWGNDIPMTEVEDGVYMLELSSVWGEFKFRANESWDNNFGTALQYKLEIGTPGYYPVAQGGQNFLIMGGKNVVFTLDTNNKTLKVEGEFAKDGYAMRMEYNNWIWSADRVFEETDEGYLELYVPYVPGHKEFKFGTYYWTGSLSSEIQNMVAGVEYQLLTDAEKGMMLDSDYFDVTFRIDPTNNKLLIKGIKADNTNLSIIGSFNDWEDDVEMTEVAVGFWRVEMKSLEGEFKIRNNKDWDINWGAYNVDQVTYWGEYTLRLGGPNFKVYKATDVVIFVDLNNGFMWFQGQIEDPDPIVGDNGNMYLIGAPAGRWDPSVGIQMTQTGEGWTWTGEIAENDYYAFATQLGEENTEENNTWTDFNANYRLSPVADGTEAVDGDYALHFGEPTGAFRGLGTYSEYTVTKNDDEYSLNVRLIAAPVSSPLNKWSLIGAFNDWNDDVEMKQVSDSVWTVTVDKLAGDFKFRANKNWKMNLGAANETEVAIGGLYATATDGGNFNIAETENVTLRLNVDNMTLSVLEGVNAGTLYLIGNPVGGFAPSKGEEMTPVEGLDHPAWEWQGEIGVDDYFCFATELDPDDNWEIFNANYRLSPAEKDMQIANGKFELLKGVDASFRGAGVETKLTVHLIDNAYSLEVELIDEPGDEETMYLIGAPAGRWDPSVGIRMTQTDEGWTWTGDIKFDDFYAFATQLGEENTAENNTWTDFNANYRLSPVADGTEAVDGDYALHFGEPTGAFRGLGTYSEYTVTKNDDEYSLNVRLIAAPVSSPLNKWSLIGAFNDWNDDVEMTQVSDSVWTVTVDKLAGEFKFRANKNWKMNLGAANETEVAIGGLYATATDGGNFNIAETENVTLRLNVDNLTLSVLEGDSSVGYISADDNEEVYFNLQGMRIARPEKGVYIRVSNGRSEKVVVR